MVAWIKLSWKGSKLIDSLLHHVGQVAQEFVGRSSSFRGIIETSSVEFGFEETLLLARVAGSLELPYIDYVDDSGLLHDEYQEAVERYGQQRTLPYASTEFGLVLLCYDPTLVRWLPTGFRLALVGLANFEECERLYGARLATQLSDLTTAVDGEPFIVAPYVASEQSFEVREIHDGVYATSGAPVTRIDVLALEDDLVFGSILKRFFEREGLDARIVTSIRDLQDLLNSGVRPSVVVSDIHLDQESGLDMLSILPKPAPPVVMLTSDASFDTELAAIQRGARAFLSKDRDPRLLAAYVKSIACECNEVSL